MSGLSRLACLAVLLCTPAAAMQAETAQVFERGRALVSTWRPTDYEGHEQNWAVLQDSDGILLVANEAGLLEFDGERWNFVQDSAGLHFRALARGPDGSIFAATTGSLGCLAVEPGGARRFVPLAGPERPELAGFEIDHMLVVGEDVLFAAGARLLAWRGVQAGPHAGKLQIISTLERRDDEPRWHILGLYAGFALVHSQSLGLQAYENGDLGGLPSVGFNPRTPPTGVVELADGEGWIVTLADGLWSLREDRVTPFLCQAGDLLRRSGCMGALLLRDGRVAFATANSGLLLCDRAGRLLEIVDREAGLGASTCLGPPYEDESRGCWLPLSFGLARYDAARSIETFGYRDGLDGPVLALLRHGADLWAGTFTGLYRLEPTDDPSRRAQFAPVEGIPVSCFDLESHGDELLVASGRGVERVVDGLLAQRVELGDAATELLNTRAGSTLAGTFNAGLVRIEYTSSGMARAVPVEGTRGCVRWLVEDELGRVWFETDTPNGLKGIARLEQGVHVLDVALPAVLRGSLTLQPFRWRGQLYAATGVGVFRWEEVPGVFALDERFLDPLEPGLRSVARVFVDADDRLWLARTPFSDLRLVDSGPDGALRFRAPLRAAGARMVQSVFSEQSGRLLWVGSSEGQVLRLTLDPSQSEDLASLDAPMIRGAALLGGASLLGDSGAQRVLPWSRGTLRFEFAAPLDGLGERALYQTRLAGLEQEFGPWSPQAAREFAGLREGRYSFEVRARNRSGRVTKTAGLDFSVRPPWQRTLWAYALGLALLTGLVATWVRVRLARHQAHVARLRSEIAEREAAERRYRSLVEELDDWVLECDGELRLTWSSPRVTSLLGRTPESVLGHTLLDLMEPALAREAQGRLARVLQGLDPFQQIDLQLLDHRGDTLELEVSGKPERAAGSLQAWRLVARDVTARRRSEEQRRLLEEQLRETRRLEAVGRLAGGISHDFNNLLTALLGNTYLLREHLSDLRTPVAGGIERCLDSIELAGQRAADLTAKLLSFSRKQVTRPEVFAVQAAIARLEGILLRVIREDIELRFELDSDTPPIEMDPAQFDNAILNLVINARDALPQGGVIAVGARPASDPEDGAPRAEVYVSDNGVGMDSATQERIFEPFFTTKEEGRGTGLGLASVHGMVQQAGGTIRVESSPGAGTTMRLSFRAALGAPACAAGPRGAVQRGSGWVLVCEDEVSIAKFLEQVLTASGYQVILSATPEEALRAAAAHSGAIDVLLTDVVLPGRNGRELAEELHATRPDLRVIFMSGYSDDVISHRGVMERGVEFIAKPFRTSELLARLGALR